MSGLSGKKIDVNLVQIVECKTLTDLESGWKFLDAQLNGIHRTLEFYSPVYETHPELLINAKYENTICGAVFGHINDEMELHVGEIAISSEFQHLGIGSKLLKKIENNARNCDLKRIILGGKKEVAPFYQSNGFTPNLFIQNKVPPTIDKLTELNPGIPVLESDVNQGWNQYLLQTNGVRPDLEQIFQLFSTDFVISYVYDKKLG